MSALSDADRRFRQNLKNAMMASGMNEESAETTLRRIADRLGGYTHEEVVQMHPLARGDKP